MATRMCAGQWCAHYCMSTLFGHCTHPPCANSIMKCPEHGRKRQPVWMRLAPPLASLALVMGVIILIGHATNADAVRWVGGSVLVLCSAAIVALVIRTDS